MNEIPHFEYKPTAHNLKEIITRINSGELDVEKEISEVVHLRYGTKEYSKTIALFSELNKLSEELNVPEELPEIITLVTSTDIPDLDLGSLGLTHIKENAGELYKLALEEKKKYEIN